MADVSQWLQTGDSAMHRSNPSSVTTSQHDAGATYDPEHLKARTRPKSRLASYLGTYRNTEKAEPASFDWSSLAVKDEAYVPKPEMMGNTILQQILNNPTKDLPARYNSFVLHILEDHRRLTAENHGQAQRLQAEVESHWEANEQFRQTLELYSSKRNILGSTPQRYGGNSMREIPEGRASPSFPRFGQDPISYVGGPAENSPKRGYTFRRHTSPSRSMTLASRAILTADGEKEILLPFSSQGANVGGHTAIGVGMPPDSKDHWPGGHPGNRLPSPPLALTSRLAERLAKRLDCLPSDLFKEVAEACAESLEHTMSNTTIGNTPDLTATAMSNAWHNERDFSVLDVRRREPSGPPLVRSGGMEDRGHQRSFSFQPGDDANTPCLSKATIGLNEPQLVQLRVSPNIGNPTYQEEVPERSSTEDSSAAPLDVLSDRDSDMSMIESSPRSRAHREISARSVTTAIKDSSYRSSSSRQERSPRLDQIPAQGSLDRSGKKYFAIAAARAAGFPDVSDKKVGRVSTVEKPPTRNPSDPTGMN